MQYQNVPYQNTNPTQPGQFEQGGTGATHAYDKPSIGIENAGGNGGMQISYNDPNFPPPNSAYFIGHAFGTSTRALSVGFCPQHVAGANAWSDPTDLNTVDTACDFQYADKFCQDNYGDQLAFPNTQAEYDTLTALVNGVDHPYMIGLHSDGAGNWEWTNGKAADMAFLIEHSNDQLQGTTETQAVFYPPTNEEGYGGFHDCCGSWVMEGFTCEFFSAPGTLAIGLGRHFDDANTFCADRYGGHLATIHS